MFTVGISKRCLLIFLGKLTNERTNERTMKINEHRWLIFFLVHVVSVCFEWFTCFYCAPTSAFLEKVDSRFFFDKIMFHIFSKTIVFPLKKD